MKKNTERRFWLWVALRSLLIFLPLLIAVVWLVQFNRGGDSVLLSFNEIHNNTYIVNDVLLSFIVASYGVVFLGLCFYFAGAVGDLSKYKGDNGRVKTLNVICILLLGLVLLTLVVYLLMILATCAGWLSDKMHQRLNIEVIVLINKYLSLGVFSIFLIADILAWWSQSIQVKENQHKLHSSPNNTHLKHTIDQNINLIGFTRDATFFVNVPTVILTTSMVILSEYLNTATRLTGTVDHHLHFYEAKNVVSPEIFGLFLNGLEAGVIVCTIIYSQIVYVIVKTKWERKQHVAKPKHRAPHPPPAAPEATPQAAPETANTGT